MARRDINEATHSADLLSLNLKDFLRYPLTEKEFVRILEICNAFWRYRGTPCKEEPHVITKSGLHSNGYVNCPEVLKFTNLSEILAYETVRALRGLWKGKVDWVIGPASGSIHLVHDMARVLHADVHSFTEKDDQGKPLLWKRFTIPLGAKVLIANEIITTSGGSTYEAKRGIADNNPFPVSFVPYAVVLVCRTKGVSLSDGTPVIARFHLDIENFYSNSCPYCLVGSEALRPKERGNWEKLLKN